MADPKLLTHTSTGDKPGGFKNIITKISDWLSPKKKEKVTWADVLEEFEIVAKPIDQHNLKLYYKNRLVGRLFPYMDDMGRDRYKIYIYYYNSDRPNKEKRMMKSLDPDARVDAEIREQKEIPYWKDGKVDASADKLIWDWLFEWMYKTKVGSERRTFLSLHANDPIQSDRKPADFTKIYTKAR
jgi:hypothetical protein